jgi:cytoskeletal protein CcmA (bactofilin family)
MMFGKSKPLEADLAVEAFKTFIDASTKVEGRITFSESIRVDGQVIGDIRVDDGKTGSIAVGPGANVRGNIVAHRVLVAGTVVGNIEASESVHLLSEAQVTGDIAYASICMVHGARVIGSLVDLAQKKTEPEKIRSVP